VVTGGAGFIGSHLARRLLGEGHEVCVVDNLATGSMENLQAAAGARFVRGDVCERRVLEQAFDGAEVVFHQAALGSVSRSVEDPLATDRVNVRGTLHCPNARTCRPRRRALTP